jgi:hypothetical protein
LEQEVLVVPMEWDQQVELLALGLAVLPLVAVVEQ